MALKKKDFYYGWVIVFSALAVVAVAVGQYHSFGIFFKPLLQEFGWTRSQVSGVFALGNVIQGISAIIVGVCSNRFSSRYFIMLSGILMGLSYIFLSQVMSIWQLYIYYSFLQSAGRGAYYNPMVATVASWFTQRLGLAIGMVLTGGGIGTLLFPMLADYLIQSYNWRISFMVFGILAGCILIVASIFIRSNPRGLGVPPYGESLVQKPQGQAEAVESPPVESAQKEGLSIGQSLQTSSFWLLILTGSLGSLAVSMVLVHLVAYATDSKISATVAASFISVIGAFNILGKLGMGAFYDRYGLKFALTICFGLSAAMLFWLSQASTVWMFYAFAALFGFAYAGWMPLFPAITAQLFGLKSMSALVGFQTAGHLLGGAVGALIAGYIFDVTQSYEPAFILAGGALVLSVFLNLLVRKPQRRAHAIVGGVS